MTLQRAADEERAAQEYADAIWAPRQEPGHFSRRNRLIIDRWSVTALMRIKRRAWEIVETGR